MLAPDTKQLVKKLASEAGFDRCGIARAEPLARGAYLRTWLDAGRAGSMEYMHRHLNVRLDPSHLLDGAKSVIVVASLHHNRAPEVTDERGEPRGRVAMYAWGSDYHKVVKKKLHAMADRLRDEVPGDHEFRACVDTAPLVEREAAAAAGVGWIGKNTLVLDHELGSYFFLGALITTLELEPDEPLPDRCGTCTACLTACPTGAFPAPYEMDASRCISYLTIEHRGEIPADLQASMGDWVFGCDVCQEVCPHNRRAPITIEPKFAIRTPGPTPLLDEILAWSEEDYREQMRGSAAKRAKLEMWKRNARIAKDNARSTPSEPPPT